MTPLRRLWVVHELLSEVKKSPDVLVNYLALDLISNLLPSPLGRRALNTHGVTMVASNLPGKKKKKQNKTNEGILLQGHNIRHYIIINTIYQHIII